MISQETAARIWNCYREIETAETILKDMDEAEEENRDEPCPETLRDAFGRRRPLQLGIPSGPACHRLLDVAPELGKSVIRAHIAAKRADLVAANEQARLEFATVSVSVSDPG